MKMVGMMGANGKTAIVTGAGSGIGRSTALALLKEGYAVILAGRRAEALEEAGAAAGPDGTRARAAPGAVGDPSAGGRLFEKTHGMFGRLDLLFNNAGAGAPP